MSANNLALVAGVHGVSGLAVAEHMASLPGTRVYGLARRAGFHGCIDTEEMFNSFFAKLRKDRIIP